MGLPNWANDLTLREEVLNSDGSVGELQMSLGKVVYKTDAVPYAKVDYWCEITEPTDSMVGIFTDVALRLWGPAGLEITALRQFYQGMGGGKSHTLTGMWHMAHDPETFLASDLGQRVTAAAAKRGHTIGPVPVKVLALCADQFSPGKSSPLFGPATTLFERFLWGLFDGDEDRYEQFRGRGANKNTVAAALEAVGRPVLVMIDELMDYVAAGSSTAYADRLQSEEHEFINALFDASDDVDRVTVLLVMIRSDFDEEGYNPVARDFRDFVQSRINRNGQPVHVSESGDFLNIIRRRLFESVPDEASVNAAVDAFVDAVDDTWREKVFDRLPGGRNLTATAETLRDTYPFHPDLVWLVQNEWSSTLHFQRVRSTVRVFAATLAHWSREHDAGRWVPPLISIGDLPLDGRNVLDCIINSGIFMGNDTAVQGFTNLAGTEVTSISGEKGQAVALDARLASEGHDAAQPRPAVRMATALFNLSLVDRSQGSRGATKEELLAAIWTPSTTFAAADEVRLRLTDDDEGLGSLEVDEPGNGRDRLWLSIKRTLNASHKAAKAQINNDNALAHAWDRIQQVAKQHTGPFTVLTVDGSDPKTKPQDLVSEIDQRDNRLVILDPRRWTLYNGDHARTKQDIESLLGRGAATVPHAASCVFVAIDKAHKDLLRKAALDVLAWEHVDRQLNTDDNETKKKIATELRGARAALDERISKAFKDFAYLTAGASGEAAKAHFDKFEEESKTSLRGDHVWMQLVADGRAVQPGALQTLDLLLSQFPRPLTPNEVVSAFYADARFPLVPTSETIINAWDDLLDGIAGGDGGWSLVDKDGHPLGLTGRGQIALNRNDVTFQPTPAETPEDDPDTTATQAGEDQPDDGDIWTAGVSDGGHGTTGAGGTPSSVTPSKPHREYSIRVQNAALTDADKRSAMFRLLMKVVDLVDPAQGEQKPELMSLALSVTTRQTDTSQIAAATEALGGKFEDDEPLA